MSTRSLRNRVSSRQPSPVNGVEAEVADLPEDGDAGRYDHHDPDVWVEPAVRKLPPSYQDHKGLERVGVLELQQPLGEPPSSKILQRLKLTLPRPSPRPTSLANDEVVTPSVESERQDLGSPMEVDGSAEPTQSEPTQEEPTIISSPPRGRPAKRDIAEMKHPVQPPDVTPSPVMSTFSNSTPQFSHKPASIQEHLRQDRVQNYVDRAIQEAEQKGDPGLVPGLRKIREDADHKRELWAVLDAIAHNQPSEEQLSIFKKFIKKGVKRHRRSTLTPSNAGVDSPQPNLAFPHHAPPSTTDDFPALSSYPPKSSTTFTSPFRTRPSSSHLQPGQAISKSAGASPSSRRHKMLSTSDRSPGQSKSTDGHRRRRSRSNSSSSSLSSAKSIPEEFAPPTDRDSEAAIADERPVKNGLLRQAHDRISAGNRTRSNAPPSKHPFAAFADVGKLNGKKFKKSREELDYDPAEVEQSRQRYLADSYQNYNYKLHLETNDRHHVPYPDDEYPLTSIEILIPPPVVHPHPVQPPLSNLRGGADMSDTDILKRIKRHRKRRYEEIDEEDLDIQTTSSSSPGPTFAPPPPPPGVLASRAGTPRVAKLPAISKARKSARVMVS